MRQKLEQIFLVGRGNQKHHPVDGDNDDFEKRPKEVKTPIGFNDLSRVMHQHLTKLSQSDFGRKLSKGIILLEKLAHSFILNALFVDMDWNPVLDTTITVASFMREFKLDRLHKALVHTFLVRLEQDKILTRTTTNDGTSNNLKTAEWTITGKPPTKLEIRAQLKQLQTDLLEYPECAAETKFLVHVAGQLYSTIRGTVNGINILFPSSDSRDFKYGATTFYENSKLMKHTKVSFMEEALLDILKENLNNNDLSEISDPTTLDNVNIVRILEIGAGTGGTTFPVLQKLTNNTSAKISYTFTDISSFFVSKAKPRFEKLFPNIDFEFKLLDIENDPIEQGYKSSDYDIIMVADVYHATQYLDDTLLHTRRLLKPNGILILGEIFQSNQFLECTFGLTEGWWRFSDDRKESPLINTKEWAFLLKRFGFVDTFAVTEGTYGVMFALADQTENY